MGHLLNSQAPRALHLLFGLGILISCDLAFACSSEDRRELAIMGYTSQQIDAQCGSGGNPFVTPSMPVARICSTRAGSCYLGERLAVGSQCWCPTRYGTAIGGVAR